MTKANWRITGYGWLADLLLIATILLPLMLPSGLHHRFGFGRELLFLSLTLIFTLAVVWSPAFSWSRIAPIWRNRLFWVTLGWLLWSFASAYFGVDFFRSFWGTTSRATGLLLFTSLWWWVWFLAAIWIPKSGWDRLLVWVANVGILTGLYGLGQALHLPGLIGLSSGRIHALTGNPIFMGGLLLLTIFITLYLGWKSKRLASRLWYGLGAILQVAAIVLSLSRGPLLGLVSGLIVWLILLWLVNRRQSGQTQRSHSKIVWLVLGILLVISFGLFWFKTPLGLERIFSYTLASNSIRSRLVTYSTLLDSWRTRPIFGFGNENVNVAWNQSYSAELGDLGYGETFTDRAHNLVIDQLTTNGLGGLLWLLAVLVAVGVYLRRLLTQNYIGPENTLWVSLIATMVAYLVYDMTAFETPLSLIYCGVLVALIASRVSSGLSTESVPLQRPVGRLSRWITGSLFAGVAGYTVIVVLIPTLANSRSTYRAEALAQREDYQTALTIQESLDQRWSPWNQFFHYSDLGWYRRGGVALYKQNKPQEALAAWEKGLARQAQLAAAEPNNVQLQVSRPLFHLLTALVMPEAKATAEVEFNALIADNSNREYFYLNWAKGLMLIEDFKAARAALDQANSLSRAPREINFWFGVLEYLEKHNDIAINYFDKASQIKINFVDVEPVLLSAITDLLFQSQKYNAALVYQQALLEMDPKKVEYHMNSALIYQALGRLDDAVNEAKMVAKLDPAKATAAQKFIDSLR